MKRGISLSVIHSEHCYYMYCVLWWLVFTILLYLASLWFTMLSLHFAMRCYQWTFRRGCLGDIFNWSVRIIELEPTQGIFDADTKGALLDGDLFFARNALIILLSVPSLTLYLAWYIQYTLPIVVVVWRLSDSFAGVIVQGQTMFLQKGFYYRLI